MRADPGVRGLPAVLALLLAAGLALLGAAPVPGQEGAARIVVETPYPLRGEPVELSVTAADGRPLPGVAVVARYRPNSEIAHEEALGVTGADGRVTWVPTDAGVVTVEATGGEPGAPPLAQAQVAVRFGAFPGLGLLVMLVAAVLLFGGAALGFRLLFSPPRRLPAEEPPST